MTVENNPTAPAKAKAPIGWKGWTGGNGLVGGILAAVFGAQNVMVKRTGIGAAILGAALIAWRLFAPDEAKAEEKPKEAPKPTTAQSSGTGSSKASPPAAPPPPAPPASFAVKRPLQPAGAENASFADRLRAHPEAFAVELSGPMTKSPTVSLTVARGDLTKVPFAHPNPKEHGIVAPQFSGVTSKAGVCGTVKELLGPQTFDRYQSEAAATPIPLGQARFIGPDEIRASDPFPVICVASVQDTVDAKAGPGIVFESAESAIRLAAEKGLKSLSFPMLQTGMNYGTCGLEQSAAAILGAAAKCAAEGIKVPELCLVVWDPKPTASERAEIARPVVEVAKEGMFYADLASAKKDTGTREFDLDAFRQRLGEIHAAPGGPPDDT